MPQFLFKQGYQAELNAKYEQESSSNLIYQPYVYDLAQYISDKTDISSIIYVGCGFDVKLKQFNSNLKIIGVDFGQNLSFFKENLNDRNTEIISINFLSELVPRLEFILKNSIIICSNIIEYLIDPRVLIDTLIKWSSLSKYLLISTPATEKNQTFLDLDVSTNINHSIEETLPEFSKFLSSCNFPLGLSGYTIKDNCHECKTTSLIISGREAVYIKQQQVPVTAIINCYNESDIIEDVILYLIKQDINIFVVDNWSTDGSFEIISKLSEEYQNINVTRFPDAPNNDFNWNEQLKNTVNISEKLGYGWYLHYDADEIRESPWQNINLREAISFVDSLGYNAIDFTILNFRYVKDDSDYEDKPLIERLRYCDFGNHPADFMQTKGWKYYGQRVNLNDSGGHNVKFEDKKVYPFHFLTRHYPLRNCEQASQKLFRDRFPRFRNERQKFGWHNHYDYITAKQLEGWDRQYLFPWHPLNFNSDYLIERISCLGISKSKPQLENKLTYQQEIAVQPHNPRLYFMLAKIQKDEGDLEQAISTSRKALELDSDSVDIVAQLSNFLIEAEQQTEALVLIKQLLESQPDNPRVCLMLGNLQRQQQDLLGAISTYQQAIKLIPQNPSSFIHLSNLLIQNNQVEEAIINGQQALELHPQNSQIYFVLGKAYAQQQDWEQAISLYQQAIKLNSQNPGVYFALGEVFREQGDLEKAIANYQKAVNFNHPNLFGVYKALGDTLTKINEIEQAISVYQQAMSIKPDHPQIKKSLEMLLTNEQLPEDKLSRI
jgi:tetratricopeptide (TPR) repeat protein